MGGPDGVPGSDPTKVDPNVATFAWNASRMSDHANVPPTYGTGFALALCWLELLVFVTMMTSQRVLYPTWYKIGEQNTEYVTDTIVTMRVAKDVVDADILINNGGTSISRAPRDVNACIKSVIVLPMIVSVWMIFNYHRYDFLPMNYEIVGECSPTNVATFEWGDICENRR